MPPRGFQNPAPKTESAREAARAFYCSLCLKGYSRHNEYETHLSSYDHSHKQRLLDMRKLTRDPNAADKARKAEKKADASAGVISIKLGEGAAAGGEKAGGFKKGGFKKAGFVRAFGEGEEVVKREEGEGADVKDVTLRGEEGGESDTGDEGYEVYDPRFPTD